MSNRTKVQHMTQVRNRSLVLSVTQDETACATCVEFSSHCKTPMNVEGHVYNKCRTPIYSPGNDIFEERVLPVWVCDRAFQYESRSNCRWVVVATSNHCSWSFVMGYATTYAQALIWLQYHLYNVAECGKYQYSPYSFPLDEIHTNVSLINKLISDSQDENNFQTMGSTFDDLHTIHISPYSPNGKVYM